jgi:hypothetical protein
MSHFSKFIMGRMASKKDTLVSDVSSPSHNTTTTTTMVETIDPAEITLARMRSSPDSKTYAE